MPEHTIAENLTRLQNAKTAIGTAITAKGGTVAAGDGLEEFAADIATIVTTTGGHEVTVTTLADAEVTLAKTGTTYTATANSNGIASFVGVATGTYTVTAVLEGYIFKPTTVTITDFSASLAPVCAVTRQVNFSTSTTSITDGTIESVTTFSGMRRCNVADNGTINAFYGDSSYTEDGTNGQVMVYVPKFWYKVNHTNSSGTALSNGAAIDIGNWSIADGPLTGYKVHPAFINASSNEVDYFLIGAFEAVFQNGSSYTSSYNSSYKMASSKGRGSLKPGAEFTREAGRTTAQARGTGWYQCGIKQISAIQMLMTVEYGCNSQTAIGQGYTYSNNTASTYVGQTTGNGTSNHSGDTSAVVYRGIENLWGNVYKWIDGLTMYGQTPYVYTGYSFADSTSIGSVLSFTVPSTNYITRFGYDSTFDWVFLPKSADSSGNTMIGDRTYTISSNTTCVACLGGSWYNGSNAGFFYWSLAYSSSYSHTALGSRIMYVPTT